MKRCLIIINPSSGKHIIQNKLDRIIGQYFIQKKKMMPIIKQEIVMRINMILSCLLVVMVL